MSVDDLRKMLEEKTLDELKTLARSVRLRRYSGLSKRDLIEALHSRRRRQLARLFQAPSFWSKYHNHVYGIVGVVGFFVSLLTFWPAASPQNGFQDAANGADEWQPEYTRKKPKIIGVYPGDAFGPLRSQGLHAFVDDFPEVKVVDLESATIADMKTNDVDGLVAELSSMLKNDNVLGVVGPPITECTRTIVEAIAASEKSVPVILESAGARSAIGWEEFGDRVPIFRISSGVDRRASEIAWLIEDLVLKNRVVRLLIEQHPGAGQRTYGEHLYEEIKRCIDAWTDYVNRGLIDATYFRTDDIASEMASIESLAQSGAVILLLGLGHHYRSIADAVYRTDEKAPGARSPLVSWMVAYSIDAPFREDGNYHNELLYEITDLNIIDAGPKPELYRKFQTEFGAPTPAVRDQAFSFDAGYCLLEAYHSVVERSFPRRPGYYPKLDENALRRVVETLRSELYRGITGDIRFGQSGQNNDGRMIYAQFNSRINAWEAVSHQEITERDASQRGATFQNGNTR